MKIVNRYGLPGAFVAAVRNDTYSGHRAAHDISVTGLLKPPQLAELERRHDDALEQDASERVWALLGQAVHTILERAEPSAIVERRLFTRAAGWTVSGQFDRLTLSEVTLQDYKVASVWEAINGLKPERVHQLNLLAEIANRNGYAVRRLEVVHILRDWSNAQAQRGGSYPTLPVRRIVVPLWSPAERSEFLDTRVRLHQRARRTERDADLAPCTPEERWQRPAQYAVKRDGRKSAIKLHDTELDAAQHAQRLEAEAKSGRGGHYVEHRPGEAVRCARYCPVAALCPQRRAELAAAEAA